MDDDNREFDSKNNEKKSSYTSFVEEQNRKNTSEYQQFFEKQIVYLESSTLYKVIASQSPGYLKARWLWLFSCNDTCYRIGDNLFEIGKYLLSFGTVTIPIIALWWTGIFRNIALNLLQHQQNSTTTGDMTLPPDPITPNDIALGALQQNADWSPLIVGGITLLAAYFIITYWLNRPDHSSFADFYEILENYPVPYANEQMLEILLADNLNGIKATAFFIQQLQQLISHLASSGHWDAIDHLLQATWKKHPFKLPEENDSSPHQKIKKKPSNPSNNEEKEPKEKKKKNYFGNLDKNKFKFLDQSNTNKKGELFDFQKTISSGEEGDNNLLTGKEFGTFKDRTFKPSTIRNQYNPNKKKKESVLEETIIFEDLSHESNIIPHIFLAPLVEEYFQANAEERNSIRKDKEVEGKKFPATFYPGIEALTIQLHASRLKERERKRKDREWKHGKHTGLAPVEEKVKHLAERLRHLAVNPFKKDDNKLLRRSIQIMSWLYTDLINQKTHDWVYFFKPDEIACKAFASLSYKEQVWLIHILIAPPNAPDCNILTAISLLQSMAALPSHHYFSVSSYFYSSLDGFFSTYINLLSKEENQKSNLRMGLAILLDHSYAPQLQMLANRPDLAADIFCWLIKTSPKKARKKENSEILLNSSDEIPFVESHNEYQSLNNQNSKKYNKSSESEGDEEIINMPFDKTNILYHQQARRLFWAIDNTKARNDICKKIDTKGKDNKILFAISDDELLAASCPQDYKSLFRLVHDSSSKTRKKIIQQIVNLGTKDQKIFSSTSHFNSQSIGNLREKFAQKNQALLLLASLLSQTYAEISANSQAYGFWKKGSNWEEQQYQMLRALLDAFIRLSNEQANESNIDYSRQDYTLNNIQASLGEKMDDAKVTNNAQVLIEAVKNKNNSKDNFLVMEIENK